MRFRPCIDIHNGKVKQIVGSSLRDSTDTASENFVAEKDASWYAQLYQKDGLRGGHVILLNPESSPWYEATKNQAICALKTAPGILQVGGGIRPDNAGQFLDAGASHVIVTSWVFRDGIIDYTRLKQITSEVGREHLVLDLSCKKKEGSYRIVTDRWQKMTEVVLSRELMEELSAYCSEFLVHAADAEGKSDGPEREVVKILSSCPDITCVYAGGIHSEEDLELIRREGNSKVDFTIGSALDLFGGNLSYRQITHQFR